MSAGFVTIEDDDEELVLYSIRPRNWEATTLLNKGSGQFSYGVLDDENEATDEESRGGCCSILGAKYPRHVGLIIGNEFCERFSYYGMRTVLVLYLTMKLHFTEDAATEIYHGFIMACYASPVIGAIIADSWLGRFRTILYISIIYACGSVLLAIGSIGFKNEIYIVAFGLILIAFGTGGIKPCVAAFGGDQFSLPQQQKLLVQFFSLFYFAINAGSMFSTLLTPILRSEVSCFGDDTCFFAAFGVPALLFIFAIVLFLIGKSLYRMVPPTGENIIVKVLKCICHALIRKFRQRSGQKRKHWMDHAVKEYGEGFVEEVKCVLKILFLFIPLPFFWTLFDQTGSRWTFQCTRMNGQLGSWVIKPDQMQAANPILILLFIPLFDNVIYPLFERCNFLTSSLRRMFWGGILAAAAFSVSGLLELSIEKSYPILPENGATHLSVVNGAECPITFTLPAKDMDMMNIVPSLSQRSYLSIDNSRPADLTFSISNVNLCDFKPELPASANISVVFQPNKAHSLFIYVDPNTSVLRVKELDFEEKEKDLKGDPLVRLVYNLDKDLILNCSEITLKRIDSDEDSVRLRISTNKHNTDYTAVEPHEYQLSVCDGDSTIVSEEILSFELGGVYNILVEKSLYEDNALVTKQLVTTKPNNVHMLYILPQYILLTAGEIMFSITGLEFSFSQAPASMKSILQAAWLLTVGLGNLLVIIIGNTAKLFEHKASEFFLFAALMVLDMLVFLVMIYFYTPYKPIITYKQDEVSRKEDIDTNIAESDASHNS